MAQTEYQRHSFVVRIWREAGLPWRGWVQHAASQEQAYVQSVEELAAFLQRRMAGSNAAPVMLEIEQGGDHAPEQS
jgi:hypothetical protein